MGRRTHNRGGWPLPRSNHRRWADVLCLLGKDAVTRAQATDIARNVAAAHGWPREVPIHTMCRRRGWLGIGRRYWEVLSNARSHGNNVSVTIDDATENVIGRNFVPAASRVGAIRMTEFEAIEIAQDVAKAEGWLWKEPISAKRRHRKWFEGGPRRYWTVLSNADSRGSNAFVKIDEATREVSISGFRRR
jgi:hypothetical protein